MTVYVDTREKPHAIARILAQFEKSGVTVVRQKLDEGDYMLDPAGKVTIDRKQNLGEVASNLTCDRARFERELRRAKDKGKTLYVLVEHGGLIRTLADVIGWRNPRREQSPYAIEGAALYKRMVYYAKAYGVRWRFCQKQQTGREILRILGENQ